MNRSLKSGYNMQLWACFSEENAFLDWPGTSRNRKENGHHRCVKSRNRLWAIRTGSGLLQSG